MSSENDFEVKFAPGAVMKGILEAPEAAELALDELRRDPMNEGDSKRLSDIEQKHGTDVLEYYGFFFQVINNSQTFLEIDFEPRVDEAVASDTTQKDVEAEIISKFSSRNINDDLTSEVVVSRSKRANMLRLAARLAIEDKLKLNKAKPRKTRKTPEDLVLITQQ